MMMSVAVDKEQSFTVADSLHEPLHMTRMASPERAAVAVDTDDRVKMLKGDKRPINNVHDRVKMLANVQYEKVDDNGLHITVNGEAQILPVENVIICAGQESNDALYQQLRALALQLQTQPSL